MQGVMVILHYKGLVITDKDARSDDNYALLWARRNLHLEVCKWLKETFKI